MASDPAITNTTMPDEFRAGVTACLRSWSALQTAVASEWGGRDSAKKAEDLRMHLYGVFLDHHGELRRRVSMEQEDLEDNLAVYMEEEFSIVLEDNSERQVADVLFCLYEACHKGDATLARQLVTSAENAAVVAAQYPSQIQSTEQDDDDDDDDSGAGRMDVEDVQPPSQPTSASFTSASDYASQYLFGTPRGVKKTPTIQQPIRQLGESIPEETTTVQTDEDGFAPVQTKSKRKSRKPV